MNHKGRLHRLATVTKSLESSLLYGAIALHLGSEKKEFWYVRDVLIATGDFLAVAVEYVAVLAPIHTKGMEAVLGFFKVVFYTAV